MIIASLGGLAHADDIMATGPEAEKVKREILDLLNEKGKALETGGPAAADFIDRHEVDSILYLGDGANQNLTKAQRSDQWRTSGRKIQARSPRDARVRVYDHGNLAVLDYFVDLAAQVGGKGQYLRKSHVLEVYVKDKNVWRVLVHDSFAIPPEKQGNGE